MSMFEKFEILNEGTGNTLPDQTLNDEAVVNYKLFIHKSLLQDSVKRQTIKDLVQMKKCEKEIIEDFILIDSRDNFKILIDNDTNTHSVMFVSLVSTMLKEEKALFKLFDEHIIQELLFLLNLSEDNYTNFEFTSKINDFVYCYIELLHFSPRIKSRYEMTLLEKIAFAKDHKSDGNKLFKEKKYLEANNLFEEAVAYLQTEKELINSEYSDLYISLLLNSANCLNNLGRFESALTKCDFILSIKIHPKALYYRGIAKINLGSETSLESVVFDIQQLKQLVSPDDAGISFLENSLENKNKQIQLSQKSLFKSLFKTSNIYDDKALPIKLKIPKEVNIYNPRVLFDIAVGNGENEPYNENDLNRVEFELFADVVPKTAENFLLLSSTKKFRNCIFHRLVKDFMIQGGDYENFNGTGGTSIYGKYFEDENFTYDHSEPGLLSMANSGPNKNGSQFFITLKECNWLNGKHVVFGKVVKGLDFILSLNNQEVGQDSRPLKVIKIVNCDMIAMNN